MKKNLLLYGVFLCALSMSSCSGGSKSSHVMDSSSMSVENANEVMKYYDTSLKILKDLVNENEIKAVLGYLDQKMPVDSLPVVSQPVVSVQDTVFVSNPGNYFNENEFRLRSRLIIPVYDISVLLHSFYFYVVISSHNFFQFFSKVLRRDEGFVC